MSATRPATSGPPVRKRKSQPRPSQIQRALRRSRWRTALAWLGGRWIALTGGLLTLAGALALPLLPHFRVEQVIVRHESSSADEALTRATQLSQVVGHNIFLVNSQRVAEEIASIPSVRHARVTPRLPSLVEIEIVERVPIASWQTPAGTFLVDDQGVLLADTSAGAVPPDLFLVKDTTGRELRVGDRVDQRSLLAARELAKAMPEAGLRVRDAEVGTSGLAFTSDTGWRIIVGPPVDLNSKLANLASVVDLAKKNGLKIAVLDLRPKDRPFYQLAP